MNFADGSTRFYKKMKIAGVVLLGWMLVTHTYLLTYFFRLSQSMNEGNLELSVSVVVVVIIMSCQTNHKQVFEV